MTLWDYIVRRTELDWWFFTHFSAPFAAVLLIGLAIAYVVLRVRR